jgi:hypothetical protein
MIPWRYRIPFDSLNWDMATIHDKMGHSASDGLRPHSLIIAAYVAFAVRETVLCSTHTDWDSPLCVVVSCVELRPNPRRVCRTEARDATLRAYARL